MCPALVRLHGTLLCLHNLVIIWNKKQFVEIIRNYIVELQLHEKFPNTLITECGDYFNTNDTFNMSLFLDYFFSSASW